MLAVQVHALGHGADQPVNRATFLSAAGEIHPAQQHSLFEGVGFEHALKEALQAILQRAELLREAVDQIAPRRVAFLLQTLHQTIVEALFQAGEFALQMGQWTVIVFLPSSRAKVIPQT